MTHSELNSSKPHRTISILFGVILLCAVFLRWHHWEAKSLWQDEIYTTCSATGNNVWGPSVHPAFFETHYGKPANPERPVDAKTYRALADHKQPWPAFWSEYKNDVQMPFYYLLMRFWGDTFGFSPIGMRLFSVLCSLFCLPLLFGIGKQLGDAKLGLLWMGIAAFSGYQIAYGQMARLYPFLLCLGLLSLWLAFKIAPPPQAANNLSETQPVTTQKKHWAGFIVIGFLGILTHYYAAFFWLAQWCYLGWQAIRVSALRKPLIISAVISAVLFYPILKLVQIQMGVVSLMALSGSEGLWKPLKLLGKLATLSMAMLVKEWSLGQIALAVILLVGVGVGLCLKDSRSETGSRQYRSIILIALGWVLIQWLALAGLDIKNHTHRIFTERYHFLVSPGIYLLLAYALWRLWQQIKPLALLCTVVSFGLLFWNGYQVADGTKAVKKQDYQGAAKLIQSKLEKNDLILATNAPITPVGLSFYLPDQQMIWGLSRDNTASPNKLWSQQSLTQKLEPIKPYPRIWLVTSHIRGDFQQTLDQYFKSHYHLKETHAFKDVAVTLYAK